MNEIVIVDEEVAEGAALLGDASRVWWIFLITGAAWLLVSIVVFRFDWRSVSAISILFGIVMIAAAIDEFLRFAGSSTGWKIAHVLIGLVFLAIGIVSFAHPGNTFKALAAVMSFYFIVAGFFELVLALASRHEEGWWLLLIAGIVQLVLGFWAAGDFGHRQVLLVVWVGATALMRGIMQIVFAFRLRGVAHAS
jgi:uncharacterized membrane protein HdeD (DUF308 family)